MAWFDNNGAHLYYEQTGTGEPVLLLPGWGGSIAELAPLRDRLAASYRVITVDLPGSGKSGPQPRTYVSSYYQDDVPIFLSLLESLQASPAHLVGFSDGGEYELLMAGLHPECARSLVTWGAAGTLGTDPEPAYLMSTLIDDPIPPMQGFAEYMKATYGEANARIMTQSLGNAARQIIEAGGDIGSSRAGNIRCPALLITGEHDFLATPSVVRELAQRIPDGQFVEAAGAGHAVHHERQDWLFDEICDWFSRVQAASLSQR